jgi:hypothetical protein
MDHEAARIPEEPRTHWNKPGRLPGDALKPFLESQRKLEDKLRNRFSKKHPDIPCHEIEALVVMTMFEMCETEPDEFFAALSGDSAQETETPQLADALDPTLLADLVQWRM